MSCSNILKIANPLSEKKLSDLLLEERKIAVEDIVRVRPGYALYKNNEKTYTILLFDQFKNLCDEFTLRNCQI